MTSIQCLKFLLFLLCHHVYSENPEPMFRARGSSIEMGYCFGVDYMLVYRSSSEGDQLLGNSSTSTTNVTPPADLQGRIFINPQQFLLGLQILNLTHMDSTFYRKECWQNQTIISQLTQQLFVCNEEIESEEIIVKEEDAVTEVRCNSTSTRLEGTSVRWYHEMFPSYKLKLFLDSSLSLKPLVEELQGLVEVRDKGALLVLDNSLLKNNQQFYCLVIKGKNCLSLQNMYLPDLSENREIFASVGEKMLLNCPSDGYNQQWETPLGKIDGSTMKLNQMYITTGDKDFSLVIPSVSDEHDGDYSCISSSLEMQYSLVLCPRKTPLPPQQIAEGHYILLKCDIDQDDQRVQWYRRQTSAERIIELIYNSNDTVPIPEDLKGRLSLSERGSHLNISNLQMNDGGVYSCVVLRGSDFLGIDDDYKDDYIDQITEDDDISDDPYWDASQRCIFKQETILSVISVKNRDITKSETSPTPDPPIASNVTPFIVGAGVVALVVLVIVIVAVIVLKKRRRAALDREQKKDITQKEDPSCAKMLPDNEC